MPLALFLSVGAVALFSFIAVATWSDNRRREREAYYKSEMLKKLAELQGDNAAAAVAILREQERNDVGRRREGIKVGGLVSAAVGAGLLVALPFLSLDRGAYLAGVIPLSVGIALLAYIYFTAPEKVDRSVPAGPRV